jgi:hypothetical protein
MPGSQHDVLTEKALDLSFRPGMKSSSFATGVNLHALLEVATAAAESQCFSSITPSLQTSKPKIRIIEMGSFHKIFLIEWDAVLDIPPVVARVPLASDRCSPRMLSTIATLSFLHQHRPRVPVPKLLDFRVEAEDPVQAPYLLSDFVEGSSLGIQEWSSMSFDSQVSVLRVVANVFCGIIEPAPCSLWGSLMQSNHPSSFQLPLPFTSYAITGLLPRQLERTPEQEFLDHITHDPTQPINLLWTARYDSAFSAFAKDPERSSSAPAGRLEELHARLLALAQSATVADRLAQHSPALAHLDFSLFRNVLFTSDRRRISAVLDWDDACLLPLPLCLRYPLELTDYRPMAIAKEIWEVPLDTPYEETGLIEEDINQTRLRKEWREIVEEVSAGEITVANWREAEVCLQLDELSEESPEGWLWKSDWIDATYQSIVQK